MARKDFEKAEKIVWRISERYPACAGERYDWCVRTGRRDKEAARRVRDAGGGGVPGKE